MSAPRSIGSIAAILDRGVDQHPDKEALVGRSGRYTWVQLRDEVARAAHGLRRAGIGPADRVAVSLPNDIDIVVAFLATQRIGAIWVGINKALAPKEKQWLLDDCAAALFVDDAPQFRDIANKGEHGDAADVDPHAPAAIAYTGGTTGYPKGVVHSQHNLLLPGYVSATAGAANADYNLGVALPLTILNLLVLGPLVAYQVGQTLVAIDRVDPVGLAGWIRDEKVATFSAVPAMIHDLLQHPEVRDDDLAPLVRPGVGGAAIPEEFRVLYRKRFGAEIYSGYGLTEAPTAVTVENPLEPRVVGSCGKALPQVEIVILDDDGNEVAEGETGEVCVRPASSGPFAHLYTPMLGYWNKPDATVEALRGGVLHTQDIGRIGEGGNLFIEDRKADLIIRGGANVYPAEVERVIHGDARVAACAVVGAPDALGERVVAFVQPNADADLDLEALRALCAEELARYKVPEEFFLVNDFERTPMGKIKKTVLRERLG